MPRAVAWTAVLCLLLAFSRTAPSAQNATDSKTPNVPIDFVGFLPGTQDPTFSGDVDVEFAIFLTPTGGRAVWSERQTVAVTNGRIEVKLGLTSPIPWSLSIANFKFASARIRGGPEVLPRMPVVNVVYASREAATPASKPYSKGSVPEADPRTGATWSEALATATREGKRLPTYLEWYAAAAAGSLRGFAGQYEWTLPWVYDTASHGELNEQFRGRFQGCDYMDLDPSLNKYAFRLCDPAPPRSK